MGKVTGFKEFPRSAVPYRAEAERLGDFDEIFSGADPEHLQTQGQGAWIVVFPSANQRRAAL